MCRTAGGLGRSRQRRRWKDAAWLAAREDAEVVRPASRGKGAAPGETGAAPPTYCTQHAGFERSICTRPEPVVIRPAHEL
jgi:hypothetical protein